MCACGSVAPPSVRKFAIVNSCCSGGSASNGANAIRNNMKSLFIRMPSVALVGRMRLGRSQRAPTRFATMKSNAFMELL